MTPRDEAFAHPDVERIARALARMPGRVIEPDRAVGYAAIAVVLRIGRGAVMELLLIRRAEAERDPWSGHVACPGGRLEPGDADLLATAIRETREETGLDLARDGRVLGTLDDISPRTSLLPPILVRPFVAAISGDTTVTASAEVAGFLWVPLHALLDETNWRPTPIAIPAVGVMERRAFHHDDYVVWGMTEGALRQLVDRLREDARLSAFPP